MWYIYYKGMGNWNDLSIKERAELIHLYMDGGVLDLPSMRKHYNSFAEGGSTEKDRDIYIDESDPEFIGPVMPVDKDKIRGLAERVNKTSNADFVKRLLDRNRKVIKNPDGTVSTHELGYVTEGDHAVVFPDIQSTENGLVRFPYPESYERAVERGDTVHMSVPDAKLFTENYKEVYPGFRRYAGGGPVGEDDHEFIGPVVPRSVRVDNAMREVSDRYNIRELAKKVKEAANSAGKTVKEIIRLYYDKEALRAKHYSSRDYTFDEAYADARGKGQRTFYWDGKYYNTDYEGAHGKQYKDDVASGKAAAFQEAYPGFTNPELRKEKQEELDTYGITNEQTRNKTFVDKNLLENLPIATTNYNVKGIGEYVDAALSAAGVNLRKRRDYNRYQKEVADEFNANHLAQLRTYLGFPLSGDSNGAPGAPVKISEFKPTVGKNDTEYYYTFKEDPFGEPVYSVDEINAKYRGTKDYPEYEKIYKKEPLEYSFYYPVADAGAADHEPYQDNNKSYLSASMGDKGGLGIFTISNTPEYRSFYDLWDFTTDIGRPYNYYDRHYYKGKPDVDKLYEAFVWQKLNNQNAYGGLLTQRKKRR